MNRLIAIVTCLVLGFVFLWPVPRASAAPAAPVDEAQLIGVLQGTGAPAEKVAACRELKLIATAKAVPALAALLPDKDLSHWARYALESMPVPEAGAALREALGKTSGLTRVGIINSLGERRDKEAVAAIAALVADADEQTAVAAAAALGKIGGAQAVAAIRAAGWQAPMTVCLARGEAILAHADQLRAAGDRKAAARIYEEACNWPVLEHVRVGAYRGWILASDDPVPLLVKALTGEDRAALRASLALARTLPGEAVTKALAESLAKVPPATQVALLEALRQRGDKAAAPAVVGATQSDHPAVRLAALDVLGTLGDANCALLLAQTAAKAKAVEQDTARQALGLLRDAKVCDTLLAALPDAPPAVQAEIVAALGLRREPQAVPTLLKMAGAGDEPARLVALKSLAMLADGRAAGDLLKLLAAASSDTLRDAAEQALTAACGRDERPQTAVPQVLAAMKEAPTPVRAALLRVAGRLGGSEALAALRAGLQDKEPAVQDAALRTMADHAPLEAAPDLLKLATQAPAVPQRVLALRGYWRLVGLAGSRPLEERWRMCEAGLAAAQRPEEKKLGLTELGKLPHLPALTLAESLGGDEAVRREAQAACAQIAAGLVATRPAQAKAALSRLAANAQDDRVRAEARKTLDAADQYVGYITSWLVAGPYRQENKQCQELFDIAFEPEKPQAKGVVWKPAPPPADPALFWQADVLSMCGGDQCVIYLKGRVFCPRQVDKARLDIGSDDGIKLWINGKLVHAKNVMRPIKAGEDRAEAALNEGWNDVFVKLTQNNMGCAVCVRLRNADGSAIEGLRFDASTGDGPAR